MDFGTCIPNICFFWTPNISPITSVISLKRCFLPKNWGPQFAKKKNSSPNNSNYFIILPNNSKRVSLKLKSSETKLVWSNLILAETCHVTSARTKTFFSSIGQLHDGDIWLQLPEFISVLLCYSNLSIPLRIKEQ